jgi:hypothetical protein
MGIQAQTSHAPHRGKVARNMQRFRIAAILAAGVSLLPAQSTLTLEPTHQSGAGITGGLEGWFKNPDGTFSFLLGYYNRNEKQELDIPIGPNNHIDPGGPDQGQPTHFLIGRQWGLFVVKVPADFGDKKLTWTLVANGKTAAIPLALKPDYEVSPFREVAVGNTPPVLSFEEKGASVQGPQGLTTERTARVGTPLSLTVWVSDDMKFTNSSSSKPKNMPPPVTLTWTKYRGPGTVVFSKEKLDAEKIPGSAPFNGKATVTATFNEPGDYMLHVSANDLSGEGGGGFQCCWSNGIVKVAVQK